MYIFSQEATLEKICFSFWFLKYINLEKLNIKSTISEKYTPFHTHTLDILYLRKGK